MEIFFGFMMKIRYAPQTLHGACLFEVKKARVSISLAKDTLLFKFMKNKLTLQELFKAYIKKLLFSK